MPNSLSWKDRGQKRFHNGASIQTDLQISKQEGPVWYSTPQRIECMIRLDFPTTNNEVEYEALVAGLDLAKAAEAENMVVYYDSQVVTSQINGNYECKNERIKKYLEEVKG